jgi:opacity protein-like surface antigen
MPRVVAFACVFALLSGVATAADLSSPQPIPLSPILTAPAPIAFNWTGFYVGTHGGWGLGSGLFTDGAIAGGQAGVNWQYGSFVVGVEADGTWVDWGDANVIATGLARGGFAFNRFHAYATGGVAARDGVELVGWVAGAGVEYALFNNWTVGAEYLHYDFADDDSEVVRARVNYLFGDRAAYSGYGNDFTHGGIFDEVRLGVLGFWQQNATSEEGVYLTGQLLFDPFLEPLDNWFLNVLARPRPNIGGNASPTGTDQVFAGLTWTVPIGRFFFAEASLGGTVHNGPITGAEVSLGCHALFRESLAAGVNLGERWRLIASIDHSSHSELCSEENDGLTHVGGSIGYRF